MDLDIVNLILDEIALEGLDGITLSTLWLRLPIREPQIQSTLDYHYKCYLWNNIILKNRELEFFLIPSPRPKFVYVDRFQFIDPDTGVCIEQETLVDCYPVNIVKDDNGDLKGSCSCFKTRKNVTSVMKSCGLDLSEIDKKYGETLVVVASQRMRYITLYGRNDYESEIYKIASDDKIYCFLERIGRSRRQGEMTFGGGNINLAFKIKPASTFPLRKKLKKHQLITVQDFGLKQRGPTNNTSGKLLMLTRFHRGHTPTYVTYLSNICSLLSKSPHERLPATQIKESLGIKEGLIRKILRLGNKYIRCEKRPRREFYPDAESKDSTSGRNTESCIKVWKLVMPYKDWTNDDEVDEKTFHDDDGEGDICSDANGFGMFPEETAFVPHLDQSTLAHCYRIMDAYGSTGLKGLELGRRMHFSIFDMRVLWKSLEKRDCVDIKKVEEGKHRLRKLCLMKNSNPTSLPKLILPGKNFKLADQSFNTSTSICESKDGNMTTSNISMDLLPLFSDNTASLRNITRANKVLEIVQELRIISDLQVFKLGVFKEEGNKLFSTKSLRKLLNLLASSNKVQIYEKTGVLESGERKFVFYCDPSVSEESSELQRAFQYQMQKERTNLLASDAKTLKKMPECENIPVVKFTSAIHNKPKFAKAKAMHQYLWYLVYGSQDNEPLAHFHSEDAIIPDWHKHISPLPKLPGHPAGWCNISDAVDNMPLSFFIDVILSSSPEDITGLEKYTHDAEKIHTRLHDIPVQIVCQLSNGRRYLFKFQVVCETLVKLGVLSFGKYDLIKKEEMFMYVHRKATLINIPSCILSSPLFANVVDGGKMSFWFNSFKDLHDYWLSFQTISLDVTLEPVIFEKTKNRELRVKFQEYLKGKAVNEIVDGGQLPGDGLGPGGTDSTLFASLRRNWCQNSEGNIEAASFAFSGYVKKHPRIKNEKTLTIGSNVVKAKAKIIKVNLDRLHKRGPSLGTKQLKKRSAKPLKPKKKPPVARNNKNPITNSYLEVPLEDASKRAEPVEEEESTLNDKIKKKRCYDKKDEEALKLMTRQRVTWSAEEDRVVLLCILTNIFLSNNSKWIIHSITVREILHEKLKSSRNKTAMACLRRKNYLLKKEEIRKNICVYHADALQDRELCDEFRNGKKYIMSHIKENEAPFRACLTKLEEKFCQQGEHYERTLDLPDTTTKFYEKFKIHEPYTSLTTTLKDPTNVNQIDFYVLQNVMHAIALLTDKIGRAHELYQLLTMYPQSTLSPVLKYMISIGIFTKLKRYEMKMNERTTPTSVGSYQLTQRYHYLWLVTYPKTIFKSTFDLFTAFPPDPRDPCHSSEFMEMEDSTAAAALMTTLMAIDVIHIETTAPAEVVVIQPTFDMPSPTKESRARTKPSKKQNKKQTDCDDDSDDSDDSDFFEGIDPKASTNSRTLLSWYRCQYMHSKSSKLMDSSNNLFINSCAVSIKLSPQFKKTGTPSTSYTSWMNSVHALDKIREWNQSNVCIHPKTCNLILKFLRMTFPDHIDKTNLLEQCKNLVDKDSIHLISLIYEKIEAATFAGLPLQDMLSAFKDEPTSGITNILKILTALNLVIRVGINFFRYVCFEHAKNWFVQSKKNLKGRGIFYNNKCHLNFEVISMEQTLKQNDCSQNEKSNQGVCSDENVVPSVGVDVEIMLVGKNFVLKQLLKKTNGKQGEAQNRNGSVELPVEEPAQTNQLSENNTDQQQEHEQQQQYPSSTTSENILQPNNSNNQDTSETDNKSVNSKSSQKSSKKRPASPLSRPAKKRRKCQELSILPSMQCASELFADEEEYEDGNETQIDFLIDQISNPNYSKTTVSTYTELLPPNLEKDATQDFPRQKTQNSKRKIESLDDSCCTSLSKKQKLDDTIYMDFVQDPDFDFSFYLRESETNPNGFFANSDDNDDNLDDCLPVASQTLSLPIPSEALCCSLPTLSSEAEKPPTLIITSKSIESPQEEEEEEYHTTYNFNRPLTFVRSPETPGRQSKQRENPQEVSTSVQANSNSLQSISESTVTAALTEMVKGNALDISGNINSPYSMTSTTSPHSDDTLKVNPTASVSSGVIDSDNCNNDTLTSKSHEGRYEGVHQLDGTADEINHDESNVETDRDGENNCESSTSGLRTSNRIRHLSTSNVHHSSNGPTPRGTYKIIRTIPRPWKTPEGTINRVALSSMLESICLYLVEHPGITRQNFLAKYQNILQPVILLEFIEILENIGVLKKKFLKHSHKASLFDPRTVIISEPDSRGDEVEVYFVSVDCIIKMGQFFNQLHANKRNPDEDANENY